MLCPLFYTRPGDEDFAPTVQHPHEDAGADIKAYAKEVYTTPSAVSFWRRYENDSVSYASGLFIDGVRDNSATETEFVNRLDECSGGVFLPPGERILVDTGFKVILPVLSQLQFPWSSLIATYKIVPRSGLANKHGITVTNSPGIIDSGYQDWVKVSLTNDGNDYHVFTHGSRIAQGLCELVIDQTKRQVVTNESVFELSQRSTNGFGSTGSK